MSNTLPNFVPPGVDPRMFAFLQAQRQLQQGQHQQQQQQRQQQHPHPQSQSGNNGQNPRQQRNQQHNQQQQNHQHNQNQQLQYQQQQQQQKRPGGDADVASFLLQLKTNQNGEPLTESEALRMQAEHQVSVNAARVQQQHPHHQQQYQQQQQQQQQYQQQQQLPQMVSPKGAQAAPGAITGYNPHNPYGMYGYPGMVPFPQANGNFAAVAAAAAMMPQPVPQPHGNVNNGNGNGFPMQVHPHPQPVGVQGLAPMPVMPHSGMNLPHHAQQQQQQQQQQMGAQSIQGQGGASASGGSSETGPVMTDAYIESLITNDVVVNKTKNNSNGNGGKPGTENAEKVHQNVNPFETMPTDGSKSAKDDIDIPLVVPKDRDLIPDALFVALGQMKACRLQQSDRVGCYKTRTLDFLGMTCKHCGGQPGFGRYFPNSVRSLAQTTTSQTILKHIGGKCRFCPQSVRKAVLELQRQQAHKEHLTTGRPRYGSRKIFFQRMWARLHGQSEDGETAVVVEADVTPQKAREEAEMAAALNTIATKRATTPPSTIGIGSVLPVMPTNSNPSTPGSIPVSNNNTDDESADLDAAPSTSGHGDVLNINLCLNNNSNSIHKKRKLGGGEHKEGSSDDDGNSKKLRISTVAV